jgi:beta-galactosidase GanA
LERTYGALLELGVPVDFITTKQVLQDKLLQYQVLVIPAATYEQADVVQKVMTFARTGGQVVLVPNSWFFDQYNRKQDYLEPLNIQVTTMKAPKLTAGRARTGLQRDAGGEETEAPFLMGLIVDSLVTDVPKAKITTTRSTLFREQTELEGAGVRHVLQVGGNNRVLATFPGGQPALIQVPVQKGSIYYLAIPLVGDSMVELMEGVLASSGAERRIRFWTPEGKHARGLEYRAIQSGEDWLAFVNNLDRRRDQEVNLATDLKFAGIRNLTLECDLPPKFTVPAGETYILRLRHW